MKTVPLASRWCRLLSVAFLICLWVPASAGAQTSAQPAERKAWNAEEMQALADQLAKEMNTARQAARREPQLQDAQRPGGRKATRFLDNLRLLETSSKQLASRVGSGGGYEQTLGIARKFGVLLRDSEVLSRSLNLSEGMTKDLDAAHRTLNKIAPYYGASPLYPELKDAGDA